MSIIKDVPPTYTPILNVYHKALTHLHPSPDTPHEVQCTGAKWQ